MCWHNHDTDTDRNQLNTAAAKKQNRAKPESPKMVGETEKRVVNPTERGWGGGGERETETDRDRDREVGR